MVFESVSCFDKVSECKSNVSDDSVSSLKNLLKILVVKSLSFANSVSEITLSLTNLPQCDGTHDGNITTSSDEKVSGEQSTLCSRRLRFSLIPASVVVFSLLDVK